MKNKDKHSANSSRIKLEDLQKPGKPELPDAYFDDLETRLKQIPDQHTNKVRRIRPWYIGMAAAAVISIILLFGGLFNHADEVIGTDEAYAYLSESGYSYDPVLDVALTEALMEEDDWDEQLSEENTWLETDPYLESTSEEAILEYLGDYTDIEDVTAEY